MTHPRLMNILMIIIIVSMLIMIALQIVHMVTADDNRPSIRPRLAPTRQSPLYERFHSPEAMNTESIDTL